MSVIEDARTSRHVPSGVSHRLAASGFNGEALLGSEAEELMELEDSELDTHHREEIAVREE